MSIQAKSPEQSDLIKRTAYEAIYNPDKLFPISRQPKRDELGVTHPLPFFGYDLWNHYEVSWLNDKGKPVVALAEIIYGCDTPNIIESKSMKLYFNSFNNTKFKSIEDMRSIAQQDLADRLETDKVIVRIIPVQQFQTQSIKSRMEGFCIDDLDISCDHYHVNPDFLSTENEQVSEVLCSDLLKSNCLVTNQPDWCSVQITYTGKKINLEGLLRYIVSFRNDNEFHEQCMEKIFIHLMQYCQPEELTISGRSTRRGGLDINSIRSTKKDVITAANIRLCRQ